MIKRLKFFNICFDESGMDYGLSQQSHHQALKKLNLQNSSFTWAFIKYKILIWAQLFNSIHFHSFFLMIIVLNEKQIQLCTT